MTPRQLGFRVWSPTYSDLLKDPTSLGHLNHPMLTMGWIADAKLSL